MSGVSRFMPWFLEVPGDILEELCFGPYSCGDLRVIRFGERPADGGPGTCRGDVYPEEVDLSVDHVAMGGPAFRRGGRIGKESVLLSGPISSNWFVLSVFLVSFVTAKLTLRSQRTSRRTFLRRRSLEEFANRW